MSSTHSAIFYSRMPRKTVTTNIDILRSPSSPLQPFLGLFSSTHKNPRWAPDSISRPYLRAKLRLACICCAHVESSCAQSEFTTPNSTATHTFLVCAVPSLPSQSNVQGCSVLDMGTIVRECVHKAPNHHVRIIYDLGCIHAAVTGLLDPFSKPNLTPHISYRHTYLARN